MVFRKSSSTEEERFLSQVDKTDNHWIWNGGVNRKFRGKTMNPARIMWLIEKGRVEDGLVIKRTCDEFNCIHPDHHVHITKAEAVDMEFQSKGFAGGKGQLAMMAKLDEWDIRRIRELVNEENISQYEVAREYKVSHYCIADIIKGKTWRHVK